MYKGLSVRQPLFYISGVLHGKPDMRRICAAAVLHRAAVVFYVAACSFLRARKSS